MISNLFSNFDFEDFVVKKVADGLFDIARNKLQDTIDKINKKDPKPLLKIEKFSHADCIDYIKKHLENNFKWATNVSFRDAQEAKSLTEIFVELDLHLTPLKLRTSKDEKVTRLSFEKMLTDLENNIILLGQPGAGKTTSVKKMFIEVLLQKQEAFKKFHFPLVIRLKNLPVNTHTNGLILINELLNSLGIFYTIGNQIYEGAEDKILTHILLEIIEELNLLIILDGFDEISSQKTRDEVIKNIRLISNSLNNSKFVLTSRTADYDLHIESSKEYEICPLDTNQIKEFIDKWIGDKNKSKVLLQQLNESPYWDTTIRPLTLAHLCALYERNNSIPSRPKSIYKKIIQLLLESWNNQRSIERVSNYGKFEVDRKMDFLAKFAYFLTIEYNKVSFSKRILANIYKEICKDFELPIEDATKVINEIESHNGLILQTSNDVYEFAHKSLLEYLTAEYIARLPRLISDCEILIKVPNELAILIAISSSPNFTFFEIVHSKLGNKILNKQFLKPFLDRLNSEKPDFKPNILFPITVLLIIDIIAKKIRKIELSYEDSEILEEYPSDSEYVIELTRDFENEKIYYRECIEIAYSFGSKTVFKDVLKEFKSYYHFSECNITDSSGRRELLNWSDKIELLTNYKPKYKAPEGYDIELPKRLYLLKNLK